MTVMVGVWSGAVELGVHSWPQAFYLCKLGLVIFRNQLYLPAVLVDLYYT
jgi:hypothetical protein